MKVTTRIRELTFNRTLLIRIMEEHPLPRGFKLREEGTVATLNTKQDLQRIKSRALRAKVWFRALSKVERAIVDLTIRCVEKVRSIVLAGAISTIVTKILKSLEEDFVVTADRIGYEIAEMLCTLGERWGNKTCFTWKCDKYYVRFLGVNALNNG
jgi:5-carboxymethyl-2-hydroxymuconate isomerase